MTNSGEIAERVRNGQPLDHIPVVDFHCHLGASSEYYYIPRSGPGQVAQHMDRFGIDHAVTFCIDTTSDVAAGNRLQYEATEALPERFSALTMLHAGFPQDWAALLEEGHRRGSRGIKLISQYQGASEHCIDWSPVLEFARDKGWAVLHHQWGSPERLEHWARNFPEVVFVIGHADGLPYAGVVGKYENVYQCTCACFVVGPFATVQGLRAVMPAEKILYGSDALDLDFGTGIGPIALSDLPEREKELILGGNALSVMERLRWPVLSQQ